MPGHYVPPSQQSRSCLWFDIGWAAFWVLLACWLWQIVEAVVPLKIFMFFVLTGAWIPGAVISAIELRRRRRAAVARERPAPARPLHPLGL